MDFEQIFQELYDTMLKSFKKDVNKVKGYLLHVLEENKQALAKITNYYITGDFTNEEYETKLRQNMLKMQDQMLAIKVMKKKAVENAVNAGIDVLMKVVKII
ncbi:MAG: hypothetical protein KAS53_00595 [Candidatus Cloacimonetes bacterium]|nr:hypothetical protein [Candidatus Cloacimonadota bacterium]